MRRLFLIILASIIVQSTKVAAQQKWKPGAYASFQQFKNQIPTDTLEFGAKPMKDKFIPERVRIVRSISLTKEHFIFYNGEELYLNLRPLGIIDGFVRIPDPKPLNVFVGRPQKYTVWDPVQQFWGSSGWTPQESDRLDRDASKHYVYSLENGRLYPYTPFTLQRLLEPYPELHEAFVIDPSSHSEQSMKVYLDILNELIATEAEY